MNLNIPNITQEDHCRRDMYAWLTRALNSIFDTVLSHQHEPSRRHDARNSHWAESKDRKKQKDKQQKQSHPSPRLRITYPI